MSKKTRNILSVLIGLISIFIIGFLLFPVLEIVLKKNMEYRIKYPDSFSFNSIVVESLWLGIATFSGGYITSLISKTIFHSLMTGAFTFIIIIVIGIFINNNFSMVTLLGAATSFLFCLMGGLMRKYIYIQKHENE